MSTTSTSSIEKRRSDGGKGSREEPEEFALPLIDQKTGTGADQNDNDTGPSCNSRKKGRTAKSLSPARNRRREKSGMSAACTQTDLDMDTLERMNGLKYQTNIQMAPYGYSTINGLMSHMERPSISWHNIKYEIEPNIMQKSLNCIQSCGRNSLGSKVVWDNLCGSLQSGEMTAIMGPSGAGKSCLLGSIACQRLESLSGTIRYVGKRQVRLATIPQEDPLLEEFTVYETLWYASRLKNSNFSASEHKAMIAAVVERLKLKDCIKNSVRKCSGGEKRRLSIGTELVSSPDVLLMDEPSSGLDSSTTLLLIGLMKELAISGQMIIAITIHQPSAKVFNLFHKVIVLAPRIGCIYEGPPQEMINHVESLCSDQEGVKLPEMTNPADWIIDIACEEYGYATLDKLAQDHNDTASRERDDKLHNGQSSVLAGSILGLGSIVRKEPGESLKQCIDLERKTRKLPYLYHTWLLTLRSTTKVMRDPILILLMIGTAILVPFLFAIMFGESGSLSGCPDPLPNPLTMSFEELTQISRLKAEKMDEEKQLFDNYVLLLFVTFLIMFSSLMSAILSFPNEMQVARKEWHNSWFACSTYYIGHTIAELPLVIISPALFISLVFPLTDQDIKLERYLYSYITLVTFSMVCQSIGTLFGIIFSHSPQSATYIAPVSQVPFILVSGFFMQYDNLSGFFQFLSDTSWYRHSFMGLLASVYGERCQCDANSTLLDLPDGFTRSEANWITFLADYYNLSSSEEPDGGGVAVLKDIIKNGILGGESGFAMSGQCETYKSRAIEYYNLDEDTIWIAISALAGTFLAVKAISYVALYMKIKTAEV